MTATTTHPDPSVSNQTPAATTRRSASLAGSLALTRIRRIAARLILGRPRPQRPRTAATANPRRGHRRDERGSATIEAAIGVTAFALFIGMTVAGGRIALARQAVETAANDAARAASIARTSSEASADARTAANGSLADQDVKCTTTSVQIDTSGFNTPIGTTGEVRATVSCTVKLSDLAVPGMPGSRTITETVTSPIDAYRERR